MDETMRKDIDYKFVETRQRFRAFYNENLTQKYQKLEEKRKPYLVSFYLRAALVAAFLAGSYFFGILGHIAEKGDDDWVGTIWGLILLSLCVYWWRPVENYKKDTKMLVMNKILSFWGNLTYQTDPGEEHSTAVLEQSQLFGSFNRQHYDDCFKGSYNGVNIAVSEQELRDVRGHGKNRRDVQVFNGILISLGMPKKFHGQTVVHAKGRAKPDIWVLGTVLVAMLVAVLYAMRSGFVQNSGFDERDIFTLGWFVLLGFGACVVLSCWTGKFRKMQQVMLEDVVFDKNWDVESTDQIEARFVLTPAFMERMLEVKRRFKGEEIEFSFWNNQVLIAVHTSKDMFETTSLFSSALEYSKVQEVVYQFYSVFSVVDVLLGENKKSAPV